MRTLRIIPAVCCLALALPPSALAVESIGPVEATFSRAFPGEVTIADRTTPKTDFRLWYADFCFSKPVRVEAQVRGKRSFSYTGGSDCLNADGGDDSATPPRPPDPNAVKLYADCGVGALWCSFKGQASAHGVEISDCGGDLDSDYQRERDLGACLSLTAKRKKQTRVVDWRIYYDNVLIGAETVRLSNRFIPARKGKGIYYWAGSDGYWNVCIRQNRDVYSRNGRLYCYVQTRAPRKAKWEMVTKRISGPSPGKLES
jgi:hypothetical protein